MHEEFLSATSKDFTQRYLNTYGWFPAPSGKILVHLTAVSNKALEFKDKDGHKYTAIADKGVLFEFLPVEKGLYNRKDGSVVLVQRIPARQYQRGITEANTSIKDVSYMVPVEINFDVLLDVFGKDEKYLDEYKANKRNAIALSKQIAFVGTQVMLYNHVLGKVVDKGVILDSDLFQQEVLDVLKKNGLNEYTVVVA